MKINCAFLLLLFSSVNIGAKTLNVPADQPKIQTAINAATSGDTILVSPGTYFENINFRDKNLFLTSLYLISNDTGYIRQTIIDGSHPEHPDTASCILIIHGQNSTSVVQGFTITGGKGTAWKDEHSSGIYREGGGILVASCSPVIQHNLIIRNEAINSTGLAGTGGAGIRCGDGRPQILNNVIFNNIGRYGAGLVFNYCAAIIRNNIIANNAGGEDYGGGGVWINGNITAGEPDILENNTIVNNYSAKDGGGVLLYNSGSNAILKNNIIFGNTAGTFNQIAFKGAANQVTYCNINDNISGTGNIRSNPDFKDSLFYLTDNSPCLDAGDTNSIYKDQEDTENSGLALFPSKGELRNDMGAYGGPNASVMPFFQQSKIWLNTSVSFGNNNIAGISIKQKKIIVNQSTSERNIDSIVVIHNKENLIISYKPGNALKPTQSDSIIIEWTPANEEPLVDTILIYHNALNSVNPLKFYVTGGVQKESDIKDLSVNKSLQNYPNPFTGITNIVYKGIDDIASLEIYNTKGQIVKTYNRFDTTKSVQFDGSNLPAGTYFYKVITSDQKEFTSKMVLER
jgi:hypothetical protein